MSIGTGQPNWSEIERVMAAALQLPDEEQAGYLAQQSAVIRSEVEALLDAGRRSGSFLERAAASEPPNASAGTDEGLSPGQLLGAYRIEDVLGQGGMGVVYRALDTKLNRTVAVKLLFEDLADPAARRRFQSEAQTASSLNHPHIVTVHDAGEFEGRQYLVTEYVDGGTLTDWARAEKRSWREIVGLLTGVAEGLAAAHSAGILHRDIKPDNILVARNGYAKLSDFGLAKLEQRLPCAQGTSPNATRPGMILGTIAYMSPEQASGRPADARSDIFSFGIVLYELIAGRRPFEGATDLERLQTIIHGTAPPLVADVPFPLRMVIEKALDNDPAERYQTMRDLAVDLRRVARHSGPTDGAVAPSFRTASPVRSGIKWTVAALAALVLAAMVIGGVLSIGLRRPLPQAQLVTQFEILPPPGSIFAPPINRQPFSISPDGRRLAFVITDGNGTKLWIRDLASPEMRALPGTEGVISVFWPPDSRSVFFSTSQKVMQLDLETGSGRSVAELSTHAQMGTWRGNGDLILYQGLNDIYEVRAQDGNLRKLPEGPERWPEFLPGSNRFVYVAYDSSLHTQRAMASDYPVRKPVSLMETDSRVQYAPPRRDGAPGHLFFMRGANLLAQPFDGDRMRLTGDSFPIAQNLIYYGPTLAGSFSVSRNGVLVYQAGFPNAELKWYDREGNVVGAVGGPAPYWGNVRISRDGRRVAAPVWTPETGAAATWIFDSNGKESRRLTFPPEVHRRPVWSPDGSHIILGGSKGVGGGPRLATLELGGSGSPTKYAGGPASRMTVLPTDWSSDGRFIAFDDGAGHEVKQSLIVDPTGQMVTPLLKDKYSQWGTAFSPDGSQIAFGSVGSGRAEVYVQAFQATPVPAVTGEKRQVSREGAWLVRWRADGRELFYLGADNVIYAVAVKGPLQFGDPKRLFRIAGISQYGTTRDFQFDVSPDGQRFIVPTTGSVAPPAFTVIENWQDRFHH